jgi:hypothetical protein
MRTKWQQVRENLMTTLSHLKSTMSRAQETLLQDALGAAALAVMLVIGLHLPNFI